MNNKNMNWCNFSPGIEDNLNEDILLKITVDIDVATHYVNPILADEYFTSQL